MPKPLAVASAANSFFQRSVSWTEINKQTIQSQKYQIYETYQRRMCSKIPSEERYVQHDEAFRMQVDLCYWNSVHLLMMSGQVMDHRLHYRSMHRLNLQWKMKKNEMFFFFFVTFDMTNTFWFSRISYEKHIGWKFPETWTSTWRSLFNNGHKFLLKNKQNKSRSTISD